MRAGWGGAHYWPLVAFFVYAGRHDALVGGQPVRQCEVAAGADRIVLLKVDAVDGEEVGVEVVFVAENPDDLAGPLGDRL